MAKPKTSRISASAPKPSKRSKLLPIVAALAGVALLGVLLAGGGFAFAATQEQHDAFCGSCHTQPESTYFARSTAAQASDLASAHTPKDVQCIDCHSGVGITGRMSAELLGAHNALAWYSHTAVQPAKLTRPVSDANCLKCHEQVTQTQNFNEHFHFFLARWQAADPNAATCVSCHAGHATDGRADIAWLNEPHTVAQCQACHNALGGEG